MMTNTNPEIRKAVDMLYELSMDDIVRAEYDRRQKAWMDYQSQHEGYYLDGRRDERVENARELKKEGIPLDTIIKALKLTPEEAEAI